MNQKSRYVSEWAGHCQNYIKGQIAASDEKQVCFEIRTNKYRYLVRKIISKNSYTNTCTCLNKIIYFSNGSQMRNKVIKISLEQQSNNTLFQQRPRSFGFTKQRYFTNKNPTLLSLLSIRSNIFGSVRVACRWRFRDSLQMVSCLLLAERIRLPPA